ncbi:hypothetical protein OFAG_00573 [Oxalobacter formigenes HOxBLS]|uniref:Uncharacterized protein n=2 Tax=Oxalobacter paraformigenes TaxID=556268 RepID=C3X2I4_9BURK|nr:hypothetical protein OFAG_00573 [Oxalobacter paraformigenes]
MIRRAGPAKSVPAAGSTAFSGRKKETADSPVAEAANSFCRTGQSRQTQAPATAGLRWCGQNTKNVLETRMCRTANRTGREIPPLTYRLRAKSANSGKSRRMGRPEPFRDETGKTGLQTKVAGGTGFGQHRRILIFRGDPVEIGRSPKTAAGFRGTGRYACPLMNRGFHIFPINTFPAFSPDKPY